MFQETLNLDGIAEPPKSPGGTGVRPRKPRPASGGLDLDGIAEPAAAARPAAAPRPSSPYAADDFNLDGDFTPAHSSAVSSWFERTYGRPLPVTARGQSATHDRMGLDHSRSLDIGLSPSSEEGRALIAHLREQGIPFLAYNTAKPGAATGPHIHVGHPSKRGAPGAGLDLEGIAEPLDLEGIAEPAGGEEVVRVDARPGVEPPRPDEPNVYTIEGRAERDRRRAALSDPKALFRIPLKAPAEGAHTREDVLGQASERLAAEFDVPREFVRGWLGRNRAGLYDPKTGETEEGVVSHVSMQGPALGRLLSDYQASLSLPQRAAARLGQLDDYSPGEHLTGAASAVVGPAGRKLARGADLATRPLQAASAGFWAKVRGANDPTAVLVALEEFTGGDPALGRNIIAEGLRDSDTLEAINPRLPQLLGVVAEIVADPANLIPGGAVAGALKKTAAGAKLLDKAGDAARGVGLLDRGLVDARPLGLAGEVTPFVRLGLADRAKFYPAKFLAFDADNPQHLRELIEEARSAALRHRSEAASARSAAARRDAEELAADYSADADDFAAQLRALEAEGPRAASAPPPAAASTPPPPPRPRDALDDFLDDVSGRPRPGLRESLNSQPSPVGEPGSSPPARGAAGDVGRSGRGFPEEGVSGKPPDPPASVPISPSGARADFSDAVTYRGRAMVRVTMPDGRVQTFYRSTGDNSKRAGEWFPVDRIETDPASDMGRGWFDKDRYAAGELEDPAHPLHRLGSEEHREISEALRGAGPEASRELSTPEEVNFWMARPELARLGSFHYRNGARSFDDFAREMVDEAGESVTPHLRGLYDDARGAGGAADDAAAPLDLEGIAEPARAGERGAADAGVLARVGRNLFDIIQLPKVLRGGFDTGTFQQGAFQTFAHPGRLPKVFREQARALVSEEEFADFARSVTSHPDYASGLMDRAGLYLASPVEMMPGGGPRFLREESFASGLARKTPAVKQVNRAYVTGADTQRLMAWEHYTKDLVRPEAGGDIAPFKAVAEFVNATTGRGRVPILDRSELGKKVVGWLNVPLFSPRRWMSKINLISPYSLGRDLINPATRPVAYTRIKESVRAAGTLGLTLGLLEMIPGVDVQWDPRRSGFLKIRVGEKTVYSVDGGEAYTIQYLAQMADAFGRMAQGKKVSERRTPLELTKRYFRAQLSPSFKVGTDWATGETIDGREFSKLQAAADLVVPMPAAAVYDGWVEGGGSTLSEVAQAGWYRNAVGLQTGAGGALKALPGFAGAGTGFYARPGEGDAPERSKEQLAREEAREVGERRARVEVLLEAGAGTARAELARHGVFVKVPADAPEEYRRRMAEEVGRAVEQAAAGEEYGRFEKDSQRREYLKHVVSAARERVDNEAKRLGYFPAEKLRPEQVEQSAKMMEAADPAVRGELQRLGVVVKPVGDGVSVEGVGGDSISLRGNNVGQGPEHVEAYRRRVVELISERVGAAMRERGYGSFESDEDRAEYVRNIIRQAAGDAGNEFRRETRGRDLGERERLERYQRDLERRTKDKPTLRRQDAPPAPESRSGWQPFPADSGTLGVPRSSMPQVRGEHRGALVQFLRARGIEHSREEVAPSSLKPTQAEYSPAKVERSRTFEGPPRAILISSDGYVIDGHHEWVKNLEDAPSEPIPVIRLGAEALPLLLEVSQFPSSGTDRASAIKPRRSPARA